VAQGRVWLGDQAKERGLVDEMGGLDKAVELVKQKAKIPASERVSISIYPGRRSFIDLLMKKSQEDALDTAVAKVAGRVPFRAWLHTGLLRVMTYWVDIK